MNEIENLITKIRHFAELREWQQFHSPRNLLLALIGEIGELAAELQWMTDQDIERRLQDPKFSNAIEEEIADVGIYFLRLTEVLGIDLEGSIERKLHINAGRYPVEKARGNSKKYDVL